MGAQDAAHRRGVAAAVSARVVLGDFVPALGQFLGSAKGLSASTITWLTETWKTEARAFGERDLTGVDYVYLWADGITSTSASRTKAVPVGADRGARRRPQGAGRTRRRLPRGD